MIIIISLVLLFVFGTVLTCKSRDDNATIIGVILMVASGMFLVISLISLLINPMEVESNINKFLATEASIEQARETGVDVENAAIQHKIIESNQWLAKEQYYNSTIFGLWIPDKVNSLKPIK